MSGLVTVLPPSIGLLLIAALCAMTAPMAARGEMPPRNSHFGLRTRATMASDAAWEAGHRAAAPQFRAAATTAGASAVAAISAGAVGAPAGAALALVGAGYTAAITILLLGTRRAGAAARQAEAAAATPVDPWAGQG